MAPVYVVLALNRDYHLMRGGQLPARESVLQGGTLLQRWTQRASRALLGKMEVFSRRFQSFHRTPHESGELARTDLVTRELVKQ